MPALALVSCILRSIRQGLLISNLAGKKGNSAFLSGM